MTARPVTYNGIRQSVLRFEQLLCRTGAEDTSADLVLLNGFEQGLEIALAKAVVTLALDELKEDRADRGPAEPLEQHLCKATFDNALAIDKDAVLLEAFDWLAVFLQAPVDTRVINIVWGRQEFNAAANKGFD